MTIRFEHRYLLVTLASLLVSTSVAHAQTTAQEPAATSPIASPADAANQAPPSATDPALAQTGPAPTPPAPEAAPPAPAAPAAEHHDPLHISGYVQAQYTATSDGRDGVDSAGRPQNQDRFEVRRGRLKLVYTLPLAELMLQIDATPTGVALRDAEATVILPWTDAIRSRLTLGLFKSPFGFDVQYSSSDRAFPERSLLSRRFFPGERDVGAQLRGDLADGAFRYQLALLNGHTIGDAVFPGLDPNGFKDLAGRLGVHTTAVDAGVSGQFGRGYVPSASDNAATMGVDESHGAASFTRWIVGADARLQLKLPVLGKLDAYGEIAFAQNFDRTGVQPLQTAVDPMDPMMMHRITTTDADRRRQLAWYLAVVQNVTDLFQIAARIEQFDPTFDGADDTITSLTVAGLVLPTQGVKLTLAYQFVWEPAELPNNVLWARSQVRF